jgi:hypothetical protein
VNVQLSRGLSTAIPRGLSLYSQVSRAGLKEGAADIANVQARRIDIREKRGLIVAMVNGKFRFYLKAVKRI